MRWLGRRQAPLVTESRMRLRFDARSEVGRLLAIAQSCRKDTNKDKCGNKLINWLRRQIEEGERRGEVGR